ncbi:MAG TPA: sugar ABC transporter permease [Victivallales bacterium]|nr:sugar ABC transporter permease [Victivallales bacterium]
MRNSVINKIKGYNSLAGYFFIAPVVLLMTVFLIYPTIYSFILSFKEFSFFSPADSKWVGLGNYVTLFRDPEFLQAFKNTFVLVLTVVPISTVLALVMAVLVNSKVKGKTFFRVSFFLPNVTSTVAIGTILGFLFRKDSFIVLFFAKLFGFENISWFADVHLALPLVIIAMIFTFSGFYMIIYLAGLQEISKDYYEAADIDGAGKVRQFLKITVPLLKNTHFLVIMMLVINTFQIFDQPYVISTFGNSSIPGGPAGSTMTLVMFLYTRAFNYFEMGYASAAAFVLFAVIFIFTIVQKRFFDLKEK